tara:strand:- start:180 stop:467 length:288 start_codon:yes stop_codon:yes gene_type:complete
MGFLNEPLNLKCCKAKDIKVYKQHWEDQAGLMETTNKYKILKLTISTDFDDNLKELQFSNHSLKCENGKNAIRLKYHKTIIILMNLNLRHLSYWA